MPKSHYTRSQFDRPTSRLRFIADRSELQIQSNEQELFPRDVLFLLQNQQNNIKSFKARIQRQKQKISKDIEGFVQQLQSLAQDLRITLQAQVDNVYKSYMDRYAKLKNEITELRKVKKRLISQKLHAQKLDFSPRDVISSNNEIIQELQKDSQNFKVFKFYNYVSDVQRNMIQDLLLYSKELMILTAADTTFYLSGSLNTQFATTKSQFEQMIQSIIGNLSLVVRNSDDLVNKLQHTEASLEISHQPPQIVRTVPHISYSQTHLPSQPAFPSHHALTHSRPVLNTHPSPQIYTPAIPNNHFTYVSQPPQPPPFLQPPQPFIPQPQSFSQPTVVYRPSQTLHNLVPVRPVMPSGNDLPLQLNQLRPFSNFHQNRDSRISVVPSQRVNNQSAIDYIYQKPSVSSILVSHGIKGTRLKSFSTEHSAQLLCLYYLGAGHLATGAKDGLLLVYQLTTKRVVARLQGARKGICCLSKTVFRGRTKVVCGCDYGGSDILVWDLDTKKLQNKFDCHQAAVTCLADLQDDDHFISGSYDKRLSVHSLRKNSTTASFNHKKTLVIAMALSKSKKKLITAGKNDMIMVWQIRKGDDIELIEERIINNNTMICCLKSLSLSTDLFVSGGKDGKLKLWSMLSGQLVSQFQVTTNSIVDMVIIQSKERPRQPDVLSCAIKQPNLILTRTSQGRNQSLQTQDRLGVKYGSGVGPVLVACEGERVASLNQQGRQVLTVDLQI